MLQHNVLVFTNVLLEEVVAYVDVLGPTCHCRSLGHSYTALVVFKALGENASIVCRNLEASSDLENQFT